MQSVILEIVAENRQGKSFKVQGKAVISTQERS